MACHPLLLVTCLMAGASLHLLFASPLDTNAVLLTGIVLLLPLLFVGLSMGRWHDLRTHAVAMLVAFAGFVLFWADSQSRLTDRLDATLVGRDVTAAVRVADFVPVGSIKRFVATPLHDRWPARLRLSWLDASVDLQPGDCWLMTMRLRRPRGFANPIRFDYERWLFLRRIGASGYVRRAIRAPHCDSRSPLIGFRNAAARRIESRFPVSDARAVMLAITLGARHELDRDRWERFAVTGTSHLMAISGLHVALASFVLYSIVRGGLCASGVAANQRTIAVSAALGFACTYALISGFAVPAQRALLMLSAALLPTLAARSVNAWRGLGLAAIIMLVTAPVTMLETGFALSFGAVLLLLWLAMADDGQRPGRPRVFRYAAQLLRLQIVLLLGMLPLVAVFFGRLTWTAPIVNVVVVPAFNLVALPAAIVGSLLPGVLGEALLTLSHQVLTRILEIIDLGAALPRAEWPLARPTALTWVIVLAVAGCGVLPRAWPARLMGIPLLVGLVCQARTVPPVDCLDLDVLDVGQGFAAVLRTHSRVMVYDTGPRFRSGSDTGRLVVVPFLRGIGVSRLHSLLISHADLDHAGGAASIAGDIPIDRLLIPAAERNRAGMSGLPVTTCVQGLAWRWDGVAFNVLGPSAESEAVGNEASCVLQVASGERRLLLTGDIGHSTERELVAGEWIKPSDVVAVPHHGSLSSSSAELIDRTSASYAITSAGFGNRWEFPRNEVVSRWESSGATHYSTARDGAVGFRLCPQAVTVRYRHRHDARRLWTAQ